MTADNPVQVGHTELVTEWGSAHKALSCCAIQRSPPLYTLSPDPRPSSGRSLSDRPQVFREMLDLDGETPRLLICIDEVSKLVDDDSRDRCWTKNGAEQKTFWRRLFSLTRATPNWLRVVMTGFTDSPSEAVSASDVGCRPFALSMITGPEQELLAAELVWAYAVENTEPFSGLLWALTKSTPGLLGLWAQFIELHFHSQGACQHKACQRQLSSAAADPHLTGVKANLGAFVI